MKRTNLFLLELVLDLVLFALCAVVCVALLLTAKGMSQESRQLTETVYIAQDAAERWRSGAPLYDCYFSNGQPDTGDPSDPSRSTLADYRVEITSTEDGAQVSVYSLSHGLEAREKPIYTLSIGEEVAVP